MKFYLVLFLLSSLPYKAIASSNANSDLFSMIERISNQENVAPFLMISIMTHESGDPRNNFKLNPYALNIKGKSYYPSSKKEAYTIIHHAMMDGYNSVGVGLGQVEWIYHSHSFKSYWDALDTEKNTEVSVKYLRDMIQYCDGDLACGVASYHNKNKSIGSKYLSFVARRCSALFGDEQCKELHDGY